MRGPGDMCMEPRPYVLDALEKEGRDGGPAPARGPVGMPSGPEGAEGTIGVEGVDACAGLKAGRLIEIRVEFS